MSGNTSPKLKLLLLLEQSQTWCNARNLRQHKCRPMIKLTEWINVAISCSPYLPHRSFVEFFTLSWVVERWNLSSVSLLLSVTPRVMLFPNYIQYKLNQASSTMVNPVAEVRNQNSKLGVRIWSQVLFSVDRYAQSANFQNLSESY
jgi:hypothetical protein